MSDSKVIRFPKSGERTTAEQKHPLTMTIMLGLPGAGKSTYVKQRFSNPEPKRLVICMDDLRLAFGYRYKEELEDFVLALALSMAAQAFRKGFNVVIDESVTSRNVAFQFVTVAVSRGAKVEMIEMMTDRSTCRYRRVIRGGFPRESFWQKEKEWQSDRDAILALTDKHIQVVQVEKEEEGWRSIPPKGFFRRLFG